MRLHSTISGMILSLASLGTFSTAGPSDDASTPLGEAVKAFNTEAAKDPTGNEQLPLTEDEVIAAIRFWKREKDSPVSNQLQDTFKEVAETRKVPANARFEVLKGLDPGGEFLFYGWWVRLQMRKPDGGTYSFPIRERLVRSVPLEERIRELEKTLRETPPLPGKYRLEDYLKQLEARLEKSSHK